MPSAILEAVYRGRTDELDRLLAARPALTLFEAAAVGDAARVRELLRHQAELVNGYADDGWTPLHLAAFFGHADALEALLALGADPRAVSRNHEANTPLHAALAGKAGERIVTHLLARGADVGATAGGGYTPLHLAAFRDDVALLNTLLAHGADPTARTREGKTALAIAEEQRHGAVARRLRGELP